jgi:phenylacetate-CoA ligase
LRATLLAAHDAYPLYRETFTRAGVTPGMACAHPETALGLLPPFAPADIDRLAREALERPDLDLGGVELTSGTTGGRPKRRVLSEGDTQRDAALVTHLLHLAGVRSDDRAVAADIVVEPLTLAFLEGCERLGVRETAAVALTPRLDAAPLLRLNPTVLFAAPSVLTRLAATLTGPDAPGGLRLVIYNGDRLSDRTAAAYRARGAGLRSLYGLTETSALGIECAAGQGIHLAAEAAVAEVRAPLPAAAGRRGERELIVTTLGVSMPLLRYPTGDLVRPVRGRCSCGSPWPRVVVRGRIGDRFAIYDQKFAAPELQALVQEEPGEFVQIVLTEGRDGREHITFRMPETARGRRTRMIERLRAHPLLDYLLYARLVRLRFDFVDPAGVGRKLPALVDRRGHRG